MSFYSGHAAFGIAVGDLNSDGFDDIAVTHWLDTVLNVYYQNSSHQFDTVNYYKKTSSQNELKISDINNDGFNDLVVANSAPISGSNPDANRYSFSIYLQDSVTRMLQVPLVYSITESQSILNPTKGLDIADLNNDGLKDIVTSSLLDSLHIWYQDGANSRFFSNPVSLRTYINTATSSIRDFNNDGVPEIIVGHEAADNISIFQQDSMYSFNSYFLNPVWLAGHLGSSEITFEDINGDGYLDVICAYQYGISVLCNESNIGVSDFTYDRNYIKVFPNPITSNKINFISTDGGTWSLFDEMGQLISEGETRKGLNEIYFDPKSCKIYFLTVYLNNGIRVTKPLLILK